MKRQVKFYWWKSYKIWEVRGKSIEDITERAQALCEKYNALHFEIL